MVATGLLTTGGTISFLTGGGFAGSALSLFSGFDLGLAVTSMAIGSSDCGGDTVSIFTSGTEAEGAGGAEGAEGTLRTSAPCCMCVYALRSKASLVLTVSVGLSRAVVACSHAQSSGGSRIRDLRESDVVSGSPGAPCRLQVRCKISGPSGQSGRISGFW